MTSRILAAALAFTACLGTPQTALAAEVIQFHRANFEAARAAKKSIIVWVQAPWCGYCKVQRPIIEKFAASSEFKDGVLYRLDFDHQKPEWARLGATMPGTLIVFKKGKEVGRAAGITNREKLTALLKSAL